MAVRIGVPALSDGGERPLQRSLVVHENHAQPPAAFAVDKPVSVDALGLECGIDSIVPS